MKYSQIRTQVSPVRVPETLMGKRAGIFFLLNEIERRKVGARKSAALAGRERLSASVSKAAKTHARAKPLLLTDEFIFT